MCSLASMLFLRFGLLPLFDPGPPKKKKRKRRDEPSKSKLSKVLRKLVPTCAAGAAKGGRHKNAKSAKESVMKKFMPISLKKSKEEMKKKKKEEEKEDEMMKKEADEMKKTEEAEKMPPQTDEADFTWTSVELPHIPMEWTLGPSSIGGMDEEEISTGQIVEMTNGKVVEMPTGEMGQIPNGQIVELSNGQFIGMSNDRRQKGFEQESANANKAQSSIAIEGGIAQQHQQQQQQVEQLQNGNCNGEQQQQQQQMNDNKKRKKSFKICKIPNNWSESFEEIKLPNTIVDKLRPQIMSSNSGSRFRIIPVENSYQRGRWKAWDYYEGTEIKKSVFLMQPEKAATTTKATNQVAPSHSSPSSPEKENVPNRLVASPNRQSLSPPTESCGTVQPLGQQQMPRRNSFQLITIKGLEERRSSSSVPTSISEEKLHLLGSPTEGEPAAGNEQKQQIPSSAAAVASPPTAVHSSSMPRMMVTTTTMTAITTIPMRTTAVGQSPPRIVEPSQSATVTAAAAAAAQINGRPIGSSSSPSLVGQHQTSPPPPLIVLGQSVVTSFQPSPQNTPTAHHPSVSPQPSQMLIHQFGQFERTLNGLGQPPNGQIPLNGQMNGQLNGQMPLMATIRPVSPQQPYFSASFGPGQIQKHTEMASRGAALARRSSSASTGAVPSSIATRPRAEDAGVAIDSKIEQAMDLVKTHLIYAVRDEIELLRRRIGDLETTVLNLEAENAVLRDHIPEEVLCALCLDTVPSAATVKSPQKTLAFSQSAKATAI